jgi:hypothetical protein
MEHINRIAQERIYGNSPLIVPIYMTTDSPDSVRLIIEKNYQMVASSSLP